MYKKYLDKGIWKSPKILRNREELEKILNKSTPKPIHVTIDPIEICNQSCIFCYYHGRKSNVMKNSSFNGKGIFPYDRLLTLIDELKEAGTEAIAFTGTGETLLYKNIYNIFQKIIDNGMEYGLTTNLSKNLTNSQINVLSKASWIRCSLNAGTSKTYKKIHRMDCFNMVLDNIKALPNINISFAYLKENIDEIVEATKLAKRIGANSITFRPEMTFSGNKKEKGIDKRIDDARTYESEHFKVYKAYDYLSINEDLLCYYSNHVAYIDAYGDVYPCCVTKFDKRYTYGNILNRNFKEFWYSKERKENYKKLDMKTCPPCTHHADNSILEMLYNKDITYNKFI